ncbi:hypothetical protein Q3G72_021419 [Acer saccharum]|nr:hypothetical protein Q3G72_021419 [Acer saccharum]
MDHDGEINRDRYQAIPTSRPKQEDRFLRFSHYSFQRSLLPTKPHSLCHSRETKTKKPQIAAQKLGLRFYNGKIRSQTAPQREEILVRFYSHCLGCCSSENTRPIDLKLHSDVLAVECAKFDHPVGNNQGGSSAAAAQKSTANGDRLIRAATVAIPRELVACRRMLR